MQPEPCSMSSEDFFEFFEGSPGLAKECNGMTVYHTFLGCGKVEEIKIRRNQPPLFTVRFPHSPRVSQFNLNLFSKVFSRVELPDDARPVVDQWSAEQAMQREAEQLAAEKARLEHEAAEEAMREVRRDEETRVTPFHFYMTREYVEMPDDLSAPALRDKVDEARTCHNKKVLMPRIDWLSEWGLRIMQGEVGLEPNWTDGQDAAAFLQEKGISSLWHFTERANLQSIFDWNGILSYEGVEAYIGQRVVFLSNEESYRRDRSLGRLSYVRLSYVPNSYFFQRVLKHSMADLVWFRFSPLLLSLGEVAYSEGNAASAYSDLRPSPLGLYIDWRELVRFGGIEGDERPPLIYPNTFNRFPEDREVEKQLSRSLNSEVLIKHFLPLEFCTGIWDARRGAPIPLP